MMDYEKVVAAALGTPIPPVPDAESAFVETLLQKSREGKIQWTKSPSGHHGKTADGALDVELTTVRTVISGVTWSSFSVKRRNEEIIRVENSFGGFMPYIGDRIEKKISELTDFLESSRVRNITSALSELERL